MLQVTEHFGHTDVGRERRVNQDAYLARSPLFAVADGMGGTQAGDVASRIAIECVETAVGQYTNPSDGSLAECAREANRQIHEIARHDPSGTMMGTTLTAAYVDRQELSIVHVGDSRAYRLRDGDLEQLTDDHSLVAELARKGKLTPEQVEGHPQRSIITRALGPEPTVDVDIETLSARAGDVYLLCSDGLTSMVSVGDVRSILRSEHVLSEAGRALIAAANAAGGYDNITVLLFRVGERNGRDSGGNPKDEASLAVNP